ncbi:DHS-like NAD/FAD-binding domain-containing protein [Martensiomyces pterosporus]|nr:DHS-like NAD/FAD-binding domain-containing protein [Martensiomyces pterosporus]
MGLGKVKIQGLYGLPKSRTAITPDVVRSVAQYFKQHRGKVLGLTGAGVSVLSGIPDYRGSRGTYRVHGEYIPILHHELVTQHSSRQRYWARSFFGIRPAFKAEPNAIHHSFAKLEQNGYLSGLITQNVDGLHLQAGSRNVLELHGTLKNVRCLSCGQVEGRDEFQGRLETLNPEWVVFWRKMVDSGEEPPRRPDGDVDLPPNLRYEDFKYPMCGHCNTGNYMPTVVFFGGNVADDVREQSYKMVDDAEALFVCGTSLATFSAYRLVKRAREQGKQVMIVNFGETRGDSDATVKLETPAEDLLPLLVQSSL